jgi:excisionase family DNA binding protein
MFERYYTTGQLAKALGVTAPTVRAWVAQELIPAARVGQRGRLRFDLEAVRQAIEAKVKRPAAGRQPAA